MAIPRKLIFTISESSFRVGRVVTWSSLLADVKKLRAANLLPPSGCWFLLNALPPNILEPYLRYPTPFANYSDHYRFAA